MDWIKDFMKPEFIWAMIGLILLLMEFVVPGLIIFFFGVGAWIVAATCFFVDDVSVNIQLVIFIVSSVVLLLALRKWLRSIFVGHTYSKQAGTQDMNDMVGQKVIVTKKIDPPQSGAVELHGVKWNAKAETAIEAGQLVEITGQDNLTLTVKSL